MQAANGVEAMTGWGIGGPSRSFVTRGGELKLGDVTIDHPLTMMSLDTGGSAAAEAFPNNVGGGVLKRFVVTLDYDHYVMYLKPVAPPVADLDTFDRSGIWINGDADGFKIVEVSKGTPAEAAGLKAGDIIVTVDGKPASAIALYDLRQRLRNDAPGTVVKFSLKGRAKDVAVTLRDLVQARTPADQKA
jgi:membrane-associated protease RseP (regulator of RpoE activity)